MAESVIQQLQRGSIITFYHKTNKKRTLKVHIDTSRTIAQPTKLSTDTIDNWFIPCDIVGQHEKKSARKPVRIRFHPDSMLLPTQQLYAAAIELVMRAFDDTWTTTPPATSDRLMQVQQIRQLLATSPTIFAHYAANQLNVIWRFNSKLRTAAIASMIVASISTAAAGGCCELRYVGTDIDALLMTLRSDEKLVDANCQLLDDGYLRLSLFREDETIDKLPFRPWNGIHWTVFGQSTIEQKMMDSTEQRIQLLHASLNQSLFVYQQAQQQKSKSSLPCSRRPLTIIYQSKNSALIDISNGEPLSEPLKVIVIEQMMMTSINNQQPITQMQQQVQSLATSPADSTDSGISTQSDEQQQSIVAPRLRQRSLSECSSMEPNHELSTIKGILKYRPMFRSVSECEHDDIADDDVDHGSSSTVVDRHYIESQGSVDSDCRKKRVSFSERVQERCFRPNSSILGQRKKNQRKAKHRRRRISTDDSTSGDDCVDRSTIGKDDKTSNSSQPTFFIGDDDIINSIIDSEETQNDKSQSMGGVIRGDSGVEQDDVVDNCKHRLWHEIVDLQQKRVNVTDQKQQRKCSTDSGVSGGDDDEVFAAVEE